MSLDSARVFLTAEWRHLVMLNYVVDPDLLKPLVPAGTELDLWQGRAYASIIGFRFLNTRVLGISIPFHRDFEEINLRFYVRRRTEDGSWRRAVVFIKEIVPRLAIAFVARTFYNEPYIALPTSHHIEHSAEMEQIKSAAYSWRFKGGSHFVRVTTSGEPKAMVEGSEAEFIAEHYWGYTAQRDGCTLEYRVEHPRWRVWDSALAEFNCDVAALYGQQYHDFLNCPPASAFLAEGSVVKVYQGVKIKN